MKNPSLFFRSAAGKFRRRLYDTIAPDHPVGMCGAAFSDAVSGSDHNGDMMRPAQNWA